MRDLGRSGKTLETRPLEERKKIPRNKTTIPPLAAAKYKSAKISSDGIDLIFRRLISFKIDFTLYGFCRNHRHLES